MIGKMSIAGVADEIYKLNAENADLKFEARDLKAEIKQFRKLAKEQNKLLEGKIAKLEE